MVNPEGYLDCKKEPKIMAFENCVHRDKEYEDIFNRCVCSDK
jgi:hypothetical protein